MNDLSEYQDIGTQVNLLDFQRYNTKVKSYRDGSCTTVYCNKDIFLPPNVILISDEEEGRQGLIDDGKKRAKEKRQAKKEMYEKYKKKLEETGELSELAMNFIKGYEAEQKYNKEHSSACSMKRAIDKIYDISMQNDWSYFFTGTISPNEKFDRCEPKEIIKPLNYWLNDRVKRKGLQYVLIPEVHPEKNEGVHFHGLINDVLTLTDSERVLFSDGKAWRRSDLECKGYDVGKYKTIYNVADWRYGFTTAIPISGCPGKLASYITKYITKDCKKLFGRYYYSSNNIVKDVDVTCLHTDEFNKVNTYACGGGGMYFKYKSDFVMREDEERDPTAEILKYLMERGALL